jgi:hypothetical protein
MTVAAQAPIRCAAALSDRARAQLLRFALEGAHLAGELAGMGGKEDASFRDAEGHLLAICTGLIDRKGPAYFTEDPDRRYALRCVIAWTARRTPRALRCELRTYAWRMELYT